MPHVLIFVISSKKSTGKGTEEDDLDADDLEDGEQSSEKPLRTTFELNDTLYAEAELEETDTVYLWLGVGTSSFLDVLLGSDNSPGQCHALV